jgi:hypothetical protein
MNTRSTLRLRPNDTVAIEFLADGTAKRITFVERKLEIDTGLYIVDFADGTSTVSEADECWAVV